MVKLADFEWPILEIISLITHSTRIIQLPSIFEFLLSFDRIKNCFDKWQGIEEELVAVVGKPIGGSCDFYYAFLPDANSQTHRLGRW